MDNPFEGQTEGHMAPSDLGWHFKYAEMFNRFQREIEDLERELEQRPPFDQGEDLSDYLDMLSTLLSFRARTRDDIEKAAREMVYA